MCEKCDEVTKLIEEWDSKKGHDRCWYYPEIFRKIANILGIQLTDRPDLPPEEEFEEFCGRYRQEEYHKGV